MAVRALVIDDEKIVRERLAGMLLALGYEVAKAASARQGLWLLESESYDLALTDASLPELDGWIVARIVRVRWPGVRVLLVTGDGESVELTGESAKLIDGIIRRPFALNHIAATLDGALRRPVVSAGVG